MIIFTESKNWLDCVVGAMINFETGLLYYKNGELIPEEKDKDGKPKPRASSATYVRATRTITIKQFSSGLLMLATAGDPLLTSIAAKLNEMYVQAGFENADAPMYRRRCIHTAAEHLSSVTASIDERADPEGNVFTPRRFINLGGSTPRTGAGFTWYYTDSVDEFLSVMDHDSYENVPVTLQLSGIIYDPMNWFQFRHGEVITRNLTLRDVRWISERLVKTCTYGNIMTIMNDAVKNDLKPLGEKRYPLLLGITVKEFDKHRKNPAYIPGFTNVDSGIHICPARGPFFEIHKWLGRPEMFSDVVSIDSMFGITIYDVLLKDITWAGLRGTYERVPPKVLEKTTWKALKPEQICQRCQTPLYDDAYVVFPDLNSRQGTPYCAACMHQRYTDSGSIDPRGNLLCNGKVLARFKPTLKLTDVLVLLPNQDQEYLEILQDKYTLQRYVEKENDKNGLVVLRGTRFVGLTKALKKYVEVCVRWGKVPAMAVFMCQPVRVS